MLWVDVVGWCYCWMERRNVKVVWWNAMRNRNSSKAVLINGTCGKYWMFEMSGEEFVAGSERSMYLP